MSRCVDSVDERLNIFPHTLQPKLRACFGEGTRHLSLDGAFKVIRGHYLGSAKAVNCSESHRGHAGGLGPRQGDGKAAVDMSL